MYPSDILSTTLWSAIGVTFKKSNLNIARAIKSIATVNAIGVIYTLMGTICKLPRMFIIRGIDIPANIKSDCFEKKPEFLIEYRSKYSIPINIRIYEYKWCTII